MIEIVNTIKARKFKDGHLIIQYISQEYDSWIRFGYFTNEVSRKEIQDIVKTCSIPRHLQEKLVEIGEYSNEIKSNPGEVCYGYITSEGIKYSISNGKLNISGNSLNQIMTLELKK